MKKKSMKLNEQTSCKMVFSSNGIPNECENESFLSVEKIYTPEEKKVMKTLQNLIKQSYRLEDEYEKHMASAQLNK